MMRFQCKNILWILPLCTVFVNLQFKFGIESFKTSQYVILSGFLDGMIPVTGSQPSATMNACCIITFIVLLKHFITT